MWEPVGITGYHQRPPKSPEGRKSSGAGKGPHRASTQLLGANPSWEEKENLKALQGGICAE
jgi:hypothetical protein